MYRCKKHNCHFSAKDPCTLAHGNSGCGLKCSPTVKCVRGLKWTWTCDFSTLPIFSLIHRLRLWRSVPHIRRVQARQISTCRGTKVVNWVVIRCGTVPWSRRTFQTLDAILSWKHCMILWSSLCEWIVSRSSSESSFVVGTTTFGMKMISVLGSCRFLLLIFVGHLFEVPT